MKRYKLVRDSFYCPSNPDWWRMENHWEIDKGQASVLGYVYFGNFGWGNDMNYMASHDITWFPPPDPKDRRPITAYKNTDKPQRDVLWADLTRSQLQGTVRTLDFKSGGNHVKGTVKVGTDGKLKLPPRGGANVAFVDSHVEWRNTPAMKHHFQRGAYDIFW
jgi:prepilin-type processing-associated H-X9-DG protein